MTEKNKESSESFPQKKPLGVNVAVFFAGLIGICIASLPSIMVAGFFQKLVPAFYFFIPLLSAVFYIKFGGKRNTATMIVWIMISLVICVFEFFMCYYLIFYQEVKKQYSGFVHFVKINSFVRFVKLILSSSSISRGIIINLLLSIIFVVIGIMFVICYGKSDKKFEPCGTQEETDEQSKNNQKSLSRPKIEFEETQKWEYGGTLPRFVVPPVFDSSLKDELIDKYPVRELRSGSNGKSYGL